MAEVIEKTDKCANPDCHCPALIGGEYCSEYCENPDRDIETGCRCGHPECNQ
jgi:hypothetical protein